MLIITAPALCPQLNIPSVACGDWGIWESLGNKELNSIMLYRYGTVMSCDSHVLVMLKYSM